MDSLTFLRLQQVFDSQFPVGGFAHSGGLETYAQNGLDLYGLSELLRNQIRLGWGRLDLAAVALAWRMGDDLDALEKLTAVMDAAKVVHGPREASVKQGQRTLKLAERLFPGTKAVSALRRPHYAVVAGALGQQLDLPQHPLVLAFGQATLTGSLAAATRSMAISPPQAQSLLVDLQPELIEATDRILENPDAALNTSTPALDIRSHQQAFLHTRLFQS